jgi:hypothetical protein
MPKCQFRWEIRRQFPIDFLRGATNELRSIVWLRYRQTVFIMQCTSTETPKFGVFDYRSNIWHESGFYQCFDEAKTMHHIHWRSDQK